MSNEATENFNDSTCGASNGARERKTFNSTSVKLEESLIHQQPSERGSWRMRDPDASSTYKHQNLKSFATCKKPGNRVKQCTFSTEKLESSTSNRTSDHGHMSRGFKGHQKSDLQKWESSSARKCNNNNNYTRTRRTSDSKESIEDALQRMIKMKDNEIVFYLQGRNDDTMKNLLEKISKQKQLFPVFFKVLFKICSSQFYQNSVISLLHNLLKLEFPTILVNFLATGSLCTPEAVNWDTFFCHFLLIFKKYFNLFPNVAAETLGPALLIAINLVEDLIKKERIDIAILNELQNVNAQRIENLSKFDQANDLKIKKGDWKHSKQPPNNFRLISSAICHKDVHDMEAPFLRSNISKGSFKDVEHYLDVQFRLLREDFVAPLREAIIQYRNLIMENETKNIKLQSLKLYNDVKFIMPDTIPYGGVIYKISFDSSKLRYVNWEQTKRFLNGTLVCLSSNAFQNFHLATIVKRDPDELYVGFVYLKPLDEYYWEINDNETFVMIESSTYFEAYYPILEGLKDISTYTMPFANNIVKVDKEISHPEYLDEDVVYDCGFLLKNKTKRNCYLLDLSTWPSHTDFDMNESQHKALKAALTQKVAIIQGPPGTGKTFLGLKVVQVLMKNKSAWGNQRRNSDEINFNFYRNACSPILIISYTNHALDQFLEAITEFVPGGIVRVGGQSKSEKLEEFNISNLKKFSLRFPNYIRESRQELQKEMRLLASNIKDFQSKLNEILETVLSQDMLEFFIFSRHFTQLEDIYCLHTQINKKKESDDNWIKIWLKLENIVEDLEAQRDFLKVKIEDKNTLTNEPLNLNSQNFKKAIESEKWELTKKEQRRQQKKLKIEMTKKDFMSEDEVLKVDNLKCLNMTDRWRLYRYWVAQFRKSVLDKITELLKKYEVICQRLKEVDQSLDKIILQNASIIGMTTTGAAKHRDTMQQVQPAIIIVEEAAEVLEAHIITALSRNCKHLILIGDQKQLRPNPTVYTLAKRYELDVSLFERLVNNGLPYERLTIQHRMRPEIASLLVPHIYDELHNHPSVEKYDNIGGMRKNVYFLNHQNNETAFNDTKSYSNEFEANMIFALARYLLLQGYEANQITILATYIGQVNMIMKLMKNTIVGKVRCTVVDNFQGEENDIILLSLVRSNEEGIVGFLKIENRVCVALSRAKKGFYCVGNFQLLCSQADTWTSVVSKLQEIDAIGSAFPLICQNHPIYAVNANVIDDFDKAPEGGCLQPCEYRMKCGHKCEKVCHIIDQEHTKIECLKTCSKVLCKKGHKCPKQCFEDCGDCEVDTEILSSCGHFNFVPCFQEKLNPFGLQKSAENLPCSPERELQRGEPSDVFKCKVLIDKDSPCGHLVTIACNLQHEEKALLNACRRPCRAVLSCGHICKGSCFECKQLRIHISCQEKCGRTLVCGHSCNVPCAETCPPCKQICENRCIHSRCPKRCGDPCEPCREPCAWQCPHKACSKLCYEFCDREPCSEPCPVVLKCGHSCIGHCGEPCPIKCRVCDKDEVCEIFFGEEDEDDSKFVLIEDCNHVVESRGMDTWMNTNTDTGSEINMKACPKCKTIIRKNLRYGNNVKTMQNDVISVKQKIISEYENLKKEVEKIRSAAFDVLFQINMFSLAKNHIKNQIEITNFNLFNVNLLNNKFKFLLKMSKMWRLADRATSNFDIVRDNLLDLEEILVQMVDKSTADSALEEFDRELKRTETLLNICVSVYRKTLIAEANNCFQELLSILSKKQQFTIEHEEIVREKIEELKELQSGLAITDTEKTEILKAMSLSKGHWFKCLNGHIYAIGECGGAMELAKCPDCGCAIGGERHQLTHDNQLATEMDGAEKPAYPTF